MYNVLGLCIVDGEWKEWSDWNTCTKTCGAGEQTRQKECDEPLYGGAACDGEDQQMQKCNEVACPGEPNLTPQ